MNEYIKEQAQKLYQDIEENTEYLETTEGDTIPCVSVENLHGIIDRLLEGIQYTISYYNEPNIAQLREDFNQIIEANI